MQAAAEDNVIQPGFQAPRVQEDVNLKLNALVLWMKILNVRALALIAVIGALSVFGIAMTDPSPLRLWGVGLYCTGVLWPTMWLFTKKA